MIQIFVSCQVQGCAEEVSYPLDMVVMFKEAPICQECYEDGDYGERDEDGVLKVTWGDLPAVKLSDLSV